MADIRFVPREEFARALELPLPPAERVALFASLCRINVLYMITRAGSGHIGTSFSCLDLVSWMYLQELQGEAPGRAADVFFSSKGHDAPAFYAVLIGLGKLPFDKIHQLRRLDGLPGHPDVGIPHVATNTGSLGMGISKAKGFLHANRLEGRRGGAYVLTGDGELQEGQFWESLVSAANHRLSDLTVIVDHNKIQSDTWVARVSDLGNLVDKLRSFGWHAVRADGHAVSGFGGLFSGLRDVQDRPKIVVADTIKGRGVSFMEAFGAEEKLYGFHSGAPDQETYQRALTELLRHTDGLLRAAGAAAVRTEAAERPVAAAPARPQRLVTAYGNELVRQAERNPRIVALDADLVKDTGLVPFAEKFPERFIECGIAEQDMVSQAGALALRRFLPVVHSFACFLSPRPNEQIYNNVTERTKVVYVGSLSGLLPAAPGHSHQCVRDISSVGGMPGMILVEPGSEAQVSQVVDFCLNQTDESCYVRLVTFPYDAPAEHALPDRLELGRGHTIVEGKDVVLLGYGPVLLGEAYKAAQLLGGHGVSARVINLPFLNRIDGAWLRSALDGARALFTLDNHYVMGGQGDMVLRAVAELGLSLRARRLGLTSVPRCGQPAEVLKAHALDAESLCATVLDGLK